MPSETTLEPSGDPTKERTPSGDVKMDDAGSAGGAAAAAAANTESNPSGTETPTKVNPEHQHHSSNKEDPDGREGAEEGAGEGVEVVLNSEGSSSVVNDHHGPPQNSQSVFRHPHPVRPRPTRAPYPPPPQSHHLSSPYPPYGSGSWGYGPPPPPHPGMEGPGGYGPPPPPHHHHPHAPYPVPPYPASSGSFEAPPPPPDHPYAPHPHQTHYSPHIQYPGPRSYGSVGGGGPNSGGADDVNVISPHHKTPEGYRGGGPRSRGGGPPSSYYQYPPTSPVSRPGSGTQRSLRNYAAMRRSNSPYSRQQQQQPPPPGSGEYGDRPWEAYGPPPPPPSGSGMRRPPPVVAESFDSAGGRAPSHPSTPKSSNHSGGASSGGNSNNKAAPPLTPSDPHMQFYGGAAGSWGSFDSAAPQPPPPPHFDDQRYYGFPPDSPYSPYQQGPAYSPGPALYRADSFPPPAYGPPPLPPSFSYSYEDEERLLQDYHPDQDGMELHQHHPYPHGGYYGHPHSKFVTPPGQSKNSKSSRSKSSTPIASNTATSRNALLPKAAEEVDFEATDPPMEPVTPESSEPACESLADVNSYDVLCGRGGGTNSQVGNRRFRQLVQDFQPTYLMAKRKEKPLLARTIVLIIRKRGGRFLKKNEETGELYEVGDTKAEAKTSQALREGLDVRATKSAANAMSGKGKSKKKSSSKNSSDKNNAGASKEGGGGAGNNSDNSGGGTTSPSIPKSESPPTLPHLEQTIAAGLVHPHSPDQLEFRKRRRVRSADRFFNDFMPPRADLNPSLGDHMDDVVDDDGVLEDVNRTPIRRNGSSSVEEISADSADSQTFGHIQQEASNCGGCGTGCAGIALDIVTGAATSSFCLAPSGWRR